MSDDIVKFTDHKVNKDLVSPLNLPVPDENDPYVEVKYMFEWMAGLCSSKSTASNYRHTALRNYIRYLEDTNDFKGPDEGNIFEISERWDDFCLVRFKSWFDDNNIKNSEYYLSGQTRETLFSALRKTINMAKKEGVAATDSLVNVSIEAGGRETKMYESYSEDEYDSILEAIKKSMRLVNSVASGYKKTGFGVDPRGYRGGWKSEENMRWYFENEMNCIPLSNTATLKKEKLHQSFFRAATNNHGGLQKLYNKWGVESQISSKLLTPLLIKLAMETGLNPDSLVSLTRDCFIERHPLTGMPCLRYWKERGSGDQDLHLVQLGEPNVSDIQLKLKQARIIQKTINLILNITDPLVDQVSEEEKNDLFLYESDSTAFFGRVMSLKKAAIKKDGNSTIVNKWMERFSRENLLATRDGDKFTFNLARFRPTLFTRLVRSGVDVMVIKDIAFHSSILTTLRYLAAHNISDKAKQQVSKALNCIYQGAKSEEADLSYANEEDINNGVKVIFKGLVADCKDIFDPPEEARKHKGYKPGSACRFFNACLECENILVTKSNLPHLASYYVSLLSSLEAHVQVPNANRLMKHLAILDEIFNPDVSEFEKEDIDRALEMAQFDNHAYDSQTAHGVADET